MLCKKECSNEIVLAKTEELGLPQKEQKQGVDLQRNALTSLINFVQLYSKVTYTHCTCRDVSALPWRSNGCFCPFCGSPNYPVFVQTFSLLVSIVVPIATAYDYY